MLTRYDQAASRAAAQVMGQYSTSFSLATRLLRGRVRADIRHLYAVVRIADELVDGTQPKPTPTPPPRWTPTSRPSWPHRNGDCTPTR